MLRVGGRLTNSQLPFNTKHQIILPNTHPLTNLIATREHEIMLHCRFQSLLNLLRRKYCPLSGWKLTREIVHKCVKCFKAKPMSITQLMGNLPQSPPFHVTGIDYAAGLITTRERRSLGQKSINRTYVSLYVLQ